MNRKCGYLNKYVLSIHPLAIRYTTNTKGKGCARHIFDLHLQRWSVFLYELVSTVRIQQNNFEKIDCDIFSVDLESQKSSPSCFNTSVCKQVSNDSSKGICNPIVLYI